MSVLHRLVALGLVIPAGFAAAQDSPPKPKTVPAVRAKLPAKLPRKFVGPPTEAAITPLDLATRLYKFADDSMMGREAGTIYNDMGTDYIARELARLGLQPAGENGTYFQAALQTTELASGATLSLDGRTYQPWTDFVPRYQGGGDRPFAGAPAIYGGAFGDTSSYLTPEQAAGKMLVMTVGRGPDGKPDHNIINRGQLTQRFRSAAAIAIIAVDYMPPGYIDGAFRSADVEAKGEVGGPPLPSYFYITREIARAIFGVDADSLKSGMTGKALSGGYRFEAKEARGRNVVAILPGSDPALRGQYVAIGAHNDHVGFNRTPADHDSVKAFMQVVRPQGADNDELPPTATQAKRVKALTDSLRRANGARVDSIYNGADDDGSGSMGVLEIAEAFANAKVKPKRSILFVWHVAEEKGLFGASYFTEHPTVPRDSIVAQLNVDMIGRGRPNDVTGTTKDGQLLRGAKRYVQLVGARRLSTELGDLIENINTTSKLGIRLDYAMDANGHPQNIYCRSDHYEYAKFGIPVTFFTTGGHADYHQVTDEPQYINYENYAAVAKLIYKAAERTANLDHRIVVDKAKPNPRAACVQ